MNKPSATRIFALDYGLARIGMAVSDPTKIIAFPVGTLKAEKKTEATVDKLVKELEAHQKANGYTILELVIGLPLMMSGKSGFLADEVKHFVSLLQPLVSFPLVLWDERLTSVQADRALRETSLTRKRRSAVIDKVAAVIILQNYLDSKIS